MYSIWQQRERRTDTKNALNAGNAGQLRLTNSLGVRATPWSHCCMIMLLCV
ncbi:conserved hypothetical protein [Enterobacterales bacterium 8AC]|nr:conserved hypothetical protein [Enterobacterales bacterium 8AC]